MLHYLKFKVNNKQEQDKMPLPKLIHHKAQRVQISRLQEHKNVQLVKIDVNGNETEALENGIYSWKLPEHTSFTHMIEYRNLCKRMEELLVEKNVQKLEVIINGYGIPHEYIEAYKKSRSLD